jgi:hypothetical protein
VVKIDVSFILLAVICLICGVSLGIAMGAAHDFQFTPVHAHLNLLGWTSLALFGLIYKVYPVLKNSWMAKAHLVISGSTAFIFPIGIYVSIAHGDPTIATAASFVALSGILIFMGNLIRTFFFAPVSSSAESAAA